MMTTVSLSNHYPDDRLFLLQPNEAYGFVVGTAGDQQLLLKTVDDKLLLVTFSHDGHLLGQRLVEVDPNEGIRKASSRLLAGLGYQEQAIQIRRFYLPEYEIGIRDLPRCLEGFASDPDKYLSFLEGEERELEAQDLNRFLADWMNKGFFVFDHNDEFWMNANGDVEAH